MRSWCRPLLTAGINPGIISASDRKARGFRDLRIPGEPRHPSRGVCTQGRHPLRRVQNRSVAQRSSLSSSDICSHLLENFRHIQQRVLDELLDISVEYEQIPINFHLTSIYDHSLHEAFSKVLHKLIDSLPYLEDLLNVFTAVSPVSSSAPRAKAHSVPAEHASIEGVPVRLYVQAICRHRCIAG